jgi:hypothetical protein
MSADIDLSSFPTQYTSTLGGGVDLSLEELKDMKLNAGLDNIKINIPRSRWMRLSDISSKSFQRSTRDDSKLIWG